MDFQKDYYAILGCALNADQSVIQAAYRALAKKHHPDANQGSDESKAKFQEIQEAYEVLSNPTKRAYYDSMRSGTSGREYAPGEEHANDSSAINAELQKRWEIVKEYYADADQIAIQLGELSPNLKLIFQIILLDTKAFKEALNLSRTIEDIYLERYFGQNEHIKQFAKRLLKHKNTYENSDALRELNRTIAILGVEAPAQVIIDKLVKKYDLHWAVFGNVPYRSGDAHHAITLPNTPAAWNAIINLAPLYGWKYNTDFRGTNFLRLGSSLKMFCLTPDEARIKIGIPLELIIKKMREG
jgi:curved DNA-binding protein CbpA